jgi:hypothetical protein
VNDQLTIQSFVPHLLITKQLSPNEITQIATHPRRDLITKFSIETGLNIEFSEQCLASNQYDERKSLTAFKILHENKSLPARAFNRQ